MARRGRNSLWLCVWLVIVVAGVAGCRTPAMETAPPPELPGSITPAAQVAATLAALVAQGDATASPSVVPTATSTPDQEPSPPPSDTRQSTQEPDSVASDVEATPSRMVTATSPPTVTPSPTALRAPDTPSPSLVPPTEPPSPTPVPPTEEPGDSASSGGPGVVMDARVVFHNGFSQGTVGVYEPGAMPWMDLLVQMDGTWYGPERQPDDGIDASPLPEGYQWQASGSFGTLPNGEAWWTESGTEGVVRLIGPGGTVRLELPIHVVFRGGGGDSDSGPAPTPT